MTEVKLITGSCDYKYPIMAAVIALICTSGFSACFRNWGLICVLLIICFQDTDRRIISNRCIISILLLAVFFQSPWELSSHLPSVILIGILLSMAAGLQLILKRRIHLQKFQRSRQDNGKTCQFLGGGDIKLLLVLGLFLGIEQSLEMLLLAGVFGLITAMAAFFRREQSFPFGPGICAATVMSLLLI